jgi:hypothetical protein
MDAGSGGVAQEAMASMRFASVHMASTSTGDASGSHGGGTGGVSW